MSNLSRLFCTKSRFFLQNGGLIGPQSTSLTKLIIHIACIHHAYCIIHGNNDYDNSNNNQNMFNVHHVLVK